VTYRESAVSWRPVITFCALWIVGVIVDDLIGSIHWVGWLLAFLAIGGVLAVVAVARQRFAAVVVDRETLRVGQESIVLSTVDVEYFDQDAGGPPAGARILGGSWSVPKERSALPIRLMDGTVVLAPCQDPEQLRGALQQACRGPG
jgi:hypothetical protein